MKKTVEPLSVRSGHPKTAVNRSLARTNPLAGGSGPSASCGRCLRYGQAPGRHGSTRRDGDKRRRPHGSEGFRGSNWFFRNQAGP